MTTMIVLVVDAVLNLKPKNNINNNNN